MHVAVAHTLVNELRSVEDAKSVCRQMIRITTDSNQAHWILALDYLERNNITPTLDA
jgi:hypothetical protein